MTYLVLSLSCCSLRSGGVWWGFLACAPSTAVLRTELESPADAVRDNVATCPLRDMLPSSCDSCRGTVLCIYSLFFFYITCTFQLNSSEVLPSATFWTSRVHRCRPFFPPVRAFNFIAHRVQHSHCSSIFIECC